MNNPFARYWQQAPHREFWRRYRTYFSKREFRSALYVSILFFAASVIFSFYAINYANEVASNAVTDIILSNIPAVNVDGFFAYGTLLLIAFIVLLVCANPRNMPFTLFSMGTFFYIRSVFTTLTHLGPFPTLPPDGDWGVLLSHFLFGADYFFSGHVGACFLMALIFWEHKALRYLFLGWSVYMSVIVLLGHYHYSIDVASAYFITYTIYVLSRTWFPRSLAIFETSPSPLPSV